jgi:hypothetical protein
VNYVTVIHSAYSIFGSGFVSLQIGPLKANVYGNTCVCMSVCVFVLKKTHVLSTIVQMLDVIKSFNFNCYSPMMD